MTPFLDIPVDGFTLLTSFTFPASATVERRWLQNDRVNALRQSTFLDFKARVIRTTNNGPNQLSFAGQLRATPGSWLFGVNAGATSSVRFWDSSGISWTQGIPIDGPAAFQTFRNNNSGVFVPLAEPWFLPDGIINYEVHQDNAVLAFYLGEPRPEVRGEVLSACLDKRAVEF